MTDNHFGFQPYTYIRFQPKLRILGKVLDLIYPILWCIHYLINFFSKQKTSESNKILIFESHLIGDTVLTSALIKGLRELFPHAEITVLGNPWITLIQSSSSLKHKTTLVPWATYNYKWSTLLSFAKTIFHLRLEKFSLSMETRGDPRNALVLFFIGAKKRIGFDHCGAKRYMTDILHIPEPFAHLSITRTEILKHLGYTSHKPFPLPEIFVNETSLNSTKQFLSQNLPNQPFVVFHPGASQSNRRFSPNAALNFIKSLLEKSQNFFIVLCGSPKEKEILSFIFDNLPPELKIRTCRFEKSLPEMIALFQLSHGAITMDSGPAHLAASQGIPLVTFICHDRPKTVEPILTTVEQKPLLITLEHLLNISMEELTSLILTYLSNNSEITKNEFSSQKNKNNSQKTTI